MYQVFAAQRLIQALRFRHHSLLHHTAIQTIYLNTHVLLVLRDPVVPRAGAPNYSSVVMVRSILNTTMRTDHLFSTKHSSSGWTVNSHAKTKNVSLYTRTSTSAGLGECYPKLLGDGLNLYRVRKHCQDEQANVGPA